MTIPDAIHEDQSATAIIPQMVQGHPLTFVLGWLKKEFDKEELITMLDLEGYIADCLEAALDEEIGNG